MARPQSLKITPSEPISIELAGASPHVFRYKMWLKLAGTPDWKFLGKGTTADAVPDRIDIPAVAQGTRLQCWLGMAGNPNVPARAEFLVEQEGVAVDGGTWDEEDPMTGKSVTAKAWILEFV